MDPTHQVNRYREALPDFFGYFQNQLISALRFVTGRLEPLARLGNIPALPLTILDGRSESRSNYLIGVSQ